MNKVEMLKQTQDIVEWVLANTEVSNQEEIAEKIGVHRTSLSNALNGNMSYVTKPFLNKLRAAFPECPYVDFNIYREKTNNEEKPHINNSTKPFTVPLLPISAQAGTLNDFVSSVQESDCEMIISPVKGSQLAITVTGESMAPKYPSGSKIYLKKIDQEAFINWGKAFVLDTYNGTILKILTPGSSPDCVNCLSLNPSEIYAPFEVQKKDIYGIYRILATVALE